jgi:hypothetical protein
MQPAMAFQEVSELGDKLAQEKLYLKEEIRREMNFKLLRALQEREFNPTERATTLRNRGFRPGFRLNAQICTRNFISLEFRGLRLKYRR